MDKASTLRKHSAIASEHTQEIDRLPDEAEDEVPSWITTLFVSVLKPSGAFDPVNSGLRGRTATPNPIGVPGNPGHSALGLYTLNAT